MRFRTPADRGSVTAEFAAVLPAIILVLAVGLGAMQLAGEQLRLQSAAGDAARLIGRGDGGAASIIGRISPGARFDQASDGDLVCVHATASANLGILGGLTLSATSCALSDGS
jgi:Flp pilus assembly protein TadG